MLYECAPLEGVTGHRFRRAHFRLFGGADRYYMPFLSPGKDRRFTPKELREILPEHNKGVPVVPQLLGRNPQDMLWAANELLHMGYREIDLNLGCPSGTVVAKGKGCGLLARPQELAALLDTLFSQLSGVAISAKVRLGIKKEEEFSLLLALLCRYPFSQLTIHPRLQTDYYRRPVRPAAFAAACQSCALPLCYNGDLQTPAQLHRTEAQYPHLLGLMVGRGLVADPALFRKARGGVGADAETLLQFVTEVYEGYCMDFGSRQNAVTRMKELWSYLLRLFVGGEAFGKPMRKAASPTDYERLVGQIITQCPIRTELPTL